MSTDVSSSARRTVTFERTFDASIEEVWDLWATKEGIESWWGPDGFVVKVQRLELRPGGELRYTMTAIAADQMDFLRKAGMPLTTDTRARYTEVDPPRRLAYSTVTDFIPDITPYEAATVVELYPIESGVKMVLTIDAMHDERWTQLAVMGWENELGKLAKVIALRASRGDAMR